MTKIMQYVRIHADELARLRELVVTDPNGAYDYVDELADTDDDRSIDTDNAWDALSYLLQRAWSGSARTDQPEATGPDSPPIDPIKGGERLTLDEWGYEPPRCLSPRDVAQAAARLAATPFAALAAHFDPAHMGDVYPDGSWVNGWGTDYLKSWYEALVEFYVTAAASHDAIVIYLS